MLTTLVEARDRIAVGLGLAVLLWLVGRLAGALVLVRAYGSALIEMPTAILQLEGSDSLAAALRSAREEPG